MYVCTICTYVNTYTRAIMFLAMNSVRHTSLNFQCESESRIMLMRIKAYVRMYLLNVYVYRHIHNYQCGKLAVAKSPTQPNTTIR